MRFDACLIALAGFPVLVSAQSLLTNGDLEEPFGAPDVSDDTVAWTLVEPDVDGSGAPVNSATFANFGNHTPGGDRGLWFRSFEGGLGGDVPWSVNATLYQDVAGHAGEEYTLSAWFRFEAHYTSQATVLALRFLDAGMSELSSTFIDINQLNANDNEWREFSVAAIGDAGTAFVRASVEMVHGQIADMNPQSAFVDDFMLVPAPAGAPVLIMAGLVATRRRRT